MLLTSPPGHKFGKGGRGYERLVRHPDEYRVPLLTAGPHSAGDTRAYSGGVTVIRYDAIGESGRRITDFMGIMTDNQADIAGTGALCGG